MSKQLKKEQETYFRKSRELRLFCSEVEAEPDKPWDYEYLFKKYIYPAQGKPKLTIMKWINIFPVDKLDFDALSQHPYIEDTWIRRFPYGNWNLQKLSQNKKFTFKNVFHCEEFIYRNWEWTNIIFKNDEVSLHTYRKILKKKWHIKNYQTYQFESSWLEHIPNSKKIYSYLSQNKYLITNWLLTKPRAPWDVELICANRKKLNSDWLGIVKSDKWPFEKIELDQNLKLETLTAYPDAPWDFPTMSTSRYLKVEFLQAFPKGNWDFRKISKNFNLELSWLQACPDGDWDFEYLSSISLYKINIDWVLAFPNSPWNFDKIGKTNQLAYKWVELLPQIPWNFQIITSRIVDPIKWIKHFPEADWDYQALLHHNQMDLDLLKIIPFGKIDFDILSESTWFKLEWLDYYPDAPWNFIKLSMNRNISLEWIQKYPDANWSFEASDWDKNKFSNIRYESEFSHSYAYSSRCSILKYHLSHFYLKIFQLSWLVKFPNLKWDYSHICDVKTLSLKFLQNHSDKPWNFKRLSRKKYITLDYLTSFPEANWQFAELSMNPNLEYSWLKNFLLLSGAFVHYRDTNFNISWFENMPEGDWVVNELFLRNCKNYSLVLYQFYHPETCVIARIPDTRNNRESISVKLLIPLMLLNPDNRPFFPEISTRLGFWETEELNKDQRRNVVTLAKAKYNFNNFYPEIVNNISKPLELQDLSGEIFPVLNWFESKDILALAHQTYPELGEFDIFLNQLENEEDFKATHSNRKIFKR